MKQFNTVVEEIAQKINSAKTIAITGHINPDGDAVASCLSLALCTAALGKEPIVLLESFPERFSFLQGANFVRTCGYDSIVPDLFICCDCGSPERMGNALGLFLACVDTIVIDHHVSNNEYGKINYVKADSSSTCELVYDIIEFIGNMDADMASALYTGIICDTGGLRFNSVSSETMIKTFRLMEFGIPFSELYAKAMLVHTFEEAMVFSRAISKMKIDLLPPVAYTTITLNDIAELGASKYSTEGIAEYLLCTEGAEIAVFVYEKSINVSKASLRSKCFNVNQIACNWGGGGHVNAAGCTINLSPQAALDQVLKLIAERYSKWNTTA